MHLGLCMQQSLLIWNQRLILNPISYWLFLLKKVCVPVWHARCPHVTNEKQYRLGIAFYTQTLSDSPSFTFKMAEWLEGSDDLLQTFSWGCWPFCLFQHTSLRYSFIWTWPITLYVLCFKQLRQFFFMPEIFHSTVWWPLVLYRVFEKDSSYFFCKIPVPQI